MRTETSLDIIVSPRASKNVIKIMDDTIKVYIKSPPVDGKANSECLKLFSKKLKIPLKQIKIKKGEKSKRKTLIVSGISYKEIMNILKVDSK